MTVFLPVLQVMSIVAIGYVVGKIFDFHQKTLSTLMLYVFMPAFVFKGLYFSELKYEDLLSLIGSNIVLIFFLLTISVLLGNLLKLPEHQKSALNMGTVFINVGNMGIPIVVFAFGEQASGPAVVNCVMGTVILNTLGVYIASRGRKKLLDSLRTVLGMPALYAAVIALMLNALHIQLPEPVINPLILLAGAMIPTILILLGTQLASFTGINSIPLIVSGSIIRLLVSPFIAVLVALLFKLSPDISRVFILQMAMPTAVNSLILSVQFDADSDTVAGIIFITTVFSILTLPVMLFFLNA